MNKQSSPITLLAAYALPTPLRISPLAQGTNNQVWRIKTPVGAYALTVYANHADARRLGFVRDVLDGLQGAGLPFAVPAPLPTRAGAYYVELAPSQEAADDAAAGNDATQPTLATLAPLIPGDHPQRDDLAQAVVGGEALGLLDRALPGLAGLQSPEAGMSWRSYGDLAHCHPLVPDPVAAIAALPIADDVRRPLADHCAELMARIPPLYASLPQQLCHEDYAPDNLLMEGTRMTGVLDFEFCARDVRVMDLTVALSWWPIAQFGSGDEWPIIRAVVQGYARHVTLTQAEVEAIPTLFQLRAYTSLIHRLGRYRQGISPLPAVADRAEAAMEREAWLRANGERLIETVGELLAPGGGQRRGGVSDAAGGQQRGRPARRAASEYIRAWGLRHKTHLRGFPVIVAMWRRRHLCLPGVPDLAAREVRAGGPCGVAPRRECIRWLPRRWPPRRWLPPGERRHDSFARPYTTRSRATSTGGISV